MTIVLPGDRVELRGEGGTCTAIKLGPGVLPSQDEPESALTAIRPGVLGRLESGATAVWVDTNSQRYVPSPGDCVVGQITNRGAESYTVSLFAAHSATLPVLAFEGATKRHRPNLKIGQLVYARVLTADRFTEPELSCVDPVSAKADGFGLLHSPTPTDSDMLFPISLGLARSLLRPSHPLLPAIAAHFPFEAAVGHNGLVWVRAAHPKHVIAVNKVLQHADQHQHISHHSSSSSDNMQEHIDLHANHIAASRGALDPQTIKTLVADLIQ